MVASVNSLHLPHGTSADEQDQVVVTPESAGWSFTGIRVVELAPGEERELDTGADEVLVVPLSGGARVSGPGFDFELRGRPDVFSGPSDFAYVPMGTTFAVTSEAGGRFAVPGARAGAVLPAAYGPASGVPVEIRGAGAATRQLHNFCAPDTFPADKLVAVECITPSGNWSSWPPHKHDTERPGEAVLEEIYYFEVAPAQPGPRRIGEGFALHRVYTDDGEIDLCEEVRQGDVVLVPRGYHGPSATAPGYDLYYLNVLAGPAAERSMTFCDDPAHHWIRESWTAQETDPRVPLRS